MNLNRMLVLSGVALGVSGPLMAEPVPGYQVDWAASQAVPLSGWATGIIILMLGFAAYSLLRKRAGRALTLAAGVALTAGLSLYSRDAPAPPIPTFLITTPFGSTTLSCTFLNGVQTTVSGGVTLTVTPLNGAPSPGPGQCSTGMRLMPGALCALCAA